MMSNNLRFYGTILLIVEFLIVAMGVRFVQLLAPVINYKKFLFSFQFFSKNRKIKNVLNLFSPVYFLTVCPSPFLLLIIYFLKRRNVTLNFK